MTYLLHAGTRKRPAPEQFAAWFDELGLTVEDGVAVSAEEGPLFRVDGPHEGGLADEVLAACQEAVWRVTVELVGAPEPSLTFGRALAQRVVDGCGGGAAFDPQFQRIVWPRPEAPPIEGTPTTRVELSWFLSRWADAPAALLEGIGAHCPEALPVHYGRYEPPEHPFHPAAFARFAQEGSGLWYSSRPSLGGGWSPPEEGVGRLRMAFDGRALTENVVLREAVVEVFGAVAELTGAFFAAAQCEPGWVETAAGQLVSTREASLRGKDHILDGTEWQGLPPRPMWLTWFAPPYRDLVTPRSDAYVAARGDGIVVRLGAEPRPNDELGDWPLPHDLTYAHRPPYVERPDGSISSVLPRPEDRAAVIPPLG